MARRNELGKIRRSQIVTIWGPGAIVDFRAGKRGGAAVSAVVTGLDEWDRSAPPAGMLHQQVIHEPRLEAKLKVAGFRLPPVDPDAQRENGRATNILNAVRFPRWLQCPECKLLQEPDAWTEAAGDPVLTCPKCSRPKSLVGVVPVRFIVACEHGHLDEFPWHIWVGHANRDCKGPLRLEGTGGAGLANLVVKCSGCGARQSMAGAFDRNALTTRGLTCRGRRPWLGTPPEEHCDAPPRALQRGASNVYFAQIASALDIPPWSDRIQRSLGTAWEDFQNTDDEAEWKVLVKVKKLVERLQMPVEKILDEIRRRKEVLARTDPNALRWEEYERFTGDPSVASEAASEFETRPEQVPEVLRGHFARIVRVMRLREVRALTGFTRIHPPVPEAFAEGETRHSDGCRKVTAIRAGRGDWLPAIEVRGEGIFLELAQEWVDRVEADPELRKRAAQIDHAWKSNWAKRFGAETPPPRTIGPTAVLLHTLSHALMRQLALECGYSGASLRERLYVDNGPRPMRGLLIYTATPDAEGTLGGLVAQGRGERFAQVFAAAVAAMQWCSSDPLCGQGMLTRSEPQSLAACHSCLHVAETSCEEFNVVLDRTTVLAALPISSH